MQVGSSRIDERLAAAEDALGAGRGLKGTGFWGVVADVKRDPALAERYGERIASIDRTAFENWALFTVPVVPGTVLMILGTVVSLALVALSYAVTGQLAKVVVFYIGLGIVLVTTHGLGHLAVGRGFGMRFTHWFIGEITQPQPGVKVDYASYLRTPARRRAWMHAAGALTTKAIPFLLIGAAIAADLPVWAVWGLPVIGLATIVTDVLWSTDKSDWKKFKREMEFAQGS
jgi:hypothetical protein